MVEQHSLADALFHELYYSKHCYADVIEYIRCDEIVWIIRINKLSGLVTGYGIKNHKKVPIELDSYEIKAINMKLMELDLV